MIYERLAVGSLIWLVNTIRPEPYQQARAVARYSPNDAGGGSHSKSVEKILPFVASTIYMLSCIVGDLVYVFRSNCRVFRSS